LLRRRRGCHPTRSVTRRTSCWSEPSGAGEVWKQVVSASTVPLVGQPV
jgi:hypothetical protein